MSLTNTSSSKRLAGIASIAVGGKTYMLAGDLVWSPSLVERETLKGMDAVHGYKETPTAPYIAGTLRDAGDLTVQDFNNMTSVNISVALANGKTIIGTNMWCVNAQEVKSTEGTFEVRFEGTTVTEN